MKMRLSSLMGLLGIVLVVAVIGMSSALRVNYQAESTDQQVNDLADRLKQAGVPVISVTVKTASPLEIEIGVQGTSDNEYVTSEDNWFQLLAAREAALSYRFGLKVDIYTVAIYNTKGEILEAGQYFLYPDTPGQQLPPPEPPKLDDGTTKEMFQKDLDLGTLSLKQLEVGMDNTPGIQGQVVYVEASAPDLDAANQFASKLFEWCYSEPDQLNEKGSHIVLCHARLVDSQGNVLLDYMKDIELREEIIRPGQGLDPYSLPIPIPIAPPSTTPTSVPTPYP